MLISADYELLGRASHVQWICPKCDSVNCDTFTFNSFELSTPNFFSPLDTSTPVSFTSSNPTFFPKSASSPKDGRSFTRRHSSKSSRHSSVQSSTSHEPGLPRKSNLHVLTVNCRSVFEKQSELAAVLDYVKPDVVCGTESQAPRDQAWRKPCCRPHQVIRGLPTLIQCLQARSHYPGWRRLHPRPRISDVR